MAGPAPPPTPGRIDLHAHTTASDGALDPEVLVAHALAAGIAILAVTDHDTVAGWTRAVGAAADTPITVIPGIELTAHVPHGSMHLLGYFPEPSVPTLDAVLEEQTLRREQRARQIVERLHTLGLPLDWEDVRAQAAGQIGRPHLAAALVSAGHAASVEEAFTRWLADGQPAFVPAAGLDPHRAVRLVREAGGAAVLAHPASLGLSVRHLEQFVQSLAAAGLSGVEVHRPEHRPEQRDAYATIARRLSLVPAGGSDFHRPDGPFAIGDTGVPPLPGATVHQLFDAIR